MCTSFVYRGKDTLIAMNYDNYGNNLKLAPYNKNLFLVTTNLYGKNRPLFGIRSNGIFANQQFVDECQAGKFRRSPTVIDTIDFIEKVLLGELTTDKINGYLNTHDIVSPLGISSYGLAKDFPAFNIHTMIVDVKGNSYIIEPGRGNLTFDKNEKYIVMSNCSIYEAKQKGQYYGFGADRQLKVEEMLAKANMDFTVKDAFEI